MINFTADAWIDVQKRSMKDKLIQINEPGMAQYFQTSKGRDFIQTIEDLSKCLVLNLSSKSSFSVTNTSKTSSQTTGVSLHTVLLWYPICLHVIEWNVVYSCIFSFKCTNV